MRKEWVYCEKYECIAENMSVVWKVSVYCENHELIAKRMSVLRKVWVYYEKYECIAKSMSVLWKACVYCEKYECVAKRMSVLRMSDFGKFREIWVLLNYLSWNLGITEWFVITMSSSIG